MIFVGLKEHCWREVFTSDLEPTENTHGNKYLAVIGPFDTTHGADFMARFGMGNPHCQCVTDAEQLAADNPELLAKD